jgi:hypothetical protein
VAAEGLFIEECHASYAFTLNFLFDKERRRSRDSVKIIFGDCLLTNALLPLLGLDQTCLFLDHWHLLNEVWPKELGLHLFKKVEDGLKKMVYAETLEGYEEAWKSVEARSVLQNPAKLTYLRTKFYEKPEMYASFKIAEVEGNMERHGSTHAA